MKVVLREEVHHLGSRGEVVNVARGYARNYLFPKGLALEATPGNLKTLAMRRKAWEDQDARELGGAKALAARLAEIKLSVTKKAGESDTLYGSVTTSEIAELLAAEGVEVDRRKIQPGQPIKSVGTFKIPVKLHREVTAEIELEVLAESTDSTEAKADEEAPAETPPGETAAESD